MFTPLVLPCTMKRCLPPDTVQFLQVHLYVKQRVVLADHNPIVLKLLLLWYDTETDNRKRSVRQHVLAEHRRPSNRPRHPSQLAHVVGEKKKTLCWREAAVSAHFVRVSFSCSKCVSLITFVIICSSSSFDSSDVFWCLMSRRSNCHTFLGRRLAEYSTSVCSSVATNQPWPTSPASPATDKKTLRHSWEDGEPRDSDSRTIQA